MFHKCNGCRFAQLKRELGSKFLTMPTRDGWTTVYELDQQPYPNQTIGEYRGRPIRFRASFRSVEHDECSRKR